MISFEGGIDDKFEGGNTVSGIITEIDKVLKVNGWVVHMHQEIGLYLGNQHLEWNCGQQWEQKY